MCSVQPGARGRGTARFGVRADDLLPLLPGLPHQVLEDVHPQPDAKSRGAVEELWVWAGMVNRSAARGSLRGGERAANDDERKDLCEVMLCTSAVFLQNESWNETPHTVWK